MKLNEFNKREILKYVGDLSQLFGIKEYTLTGGKAKGIKAFDLKNGSGLEFTVLADRGLDISGLSYKGMNCSYLSNAGIIAPEYYDEKGLGFLRSFYAGFLTTCGLRNVGSSCEDNRESFGLHGRISNTPAEEVCAITSWENGLPVLTVSGKMREARFFGENLVLQREILCRYGENKILIHNNIENYGFQREPIMLLFHFNFGFPLLDESANLLISSAEILPRDQEAEKGLKSFTIFDQPTPGYSEQVFYHKLNADKEGKTSVALINTKIGLGLSIQFNKNQLFNFTQWKQMGEGEYVLGLEPCNCYVGGRAEARKSGFLEYIDPGENKNFDLTIEILNGESEINSFANMISALNY
jgi:hypothetical protein